ncbi:hypothetical protein [Streptomyces sp. SAI-129]|uniref:hypothetical protein n=1 Tax=Streptomyces sp. SAI-129 TaxID=3377727 RepID=UPI003C7A8914
MADGTAAAQALGDVVPGQLQVDASGVGAELGVRTVFNPLGPLCNPAGPTAQAVGVTAAEALAPVAGVLARRGVSALVFRGDDGMDELTVTTTSRVWTVHRGEAREEVFDPRDLGFRLARPEELRGGNRRSAAAGCRRAAPLAGTADGTPRGGGGPGSRGRRLRRRGRRPRTVGGHHRQALRNPLTRSADRDRVGGLTAGTGPWPPRCPSRREGHRGGAGLRPRSSGSRRRGSRAAAGSRWR